MTVNFCYRKQPRPNPTAPFFRALVPGILEPKVPQVLYSGTK